MKSHESRKPAVAFLLIFLAVPRIPLALGAPQAPPAKPDEGAFQEFTKRVEQYLTLHKSAPRLRTTKQRKEIVERRDALAKKIRQARSNAKQGDIFSPEISKEFRRVIQSTMKSAKGPSVRKTIKQGEPVPGWHLSVNGDYPEHLPRTTIPPTLLLQLPQLPPGLGYRIIGHDFVLQDADARLVVDFIPGAIP